MFRFAAGGVGGAAIKNDSKFLGFAPRELVERGRGASVIRQNPADFVRNTFELRPIHTANWNFATGSRQHSKLPKNLKTNRLEPYFVRAKEVFS